MFSVLTGYPILVALKRSFSSYKVNRSKRPQLECPLLTHSQIACSRWHQACDLFMSHLFLITPLIIDELNLIKAYLLNPSTFYCFFGATVKTFVFFSEAVVMRQAWTF